MTVKPTISLTDHGYHFAKSLVENGKFASVSAVMQYGLRLVEREDEEHSTHLESIRNNLEHRANEPTLTGQDIDAELETMLVKKRQAWLGNSKV